MILRNGSWTIFFTSLFDKILRVVNVLGAGQILIEYV